MASVIRADAAPQRILYNGGDARAHSERAGPIRIAGKNDVGPHALANIATIAGGLVPIQCPTFRTLGRVPITSDGPVYRQRKLGRSSEGQRNRPGTVPAFASGALRFRENALKR